MKKIQWIRSVILGAALLASPMLAQPASAQITGGSVEAIVSENAKASFGRVVIDYKAPAGVTGFSFLEMSDGSYFGRTKISKKLVGDVYAEGEVIHGGTPVSKIGIGVGYKFPMPKGAYAKAKLLPLWTVGQGRTEEQLFAGYAAGYSRGRYKISTFGYYNLSKGEWQVGDINASVKITAKTTVFYNPGITKKGIEHRVGVGILF